MIINGTEYPITGYTTGMSLSYELTDSSGGNIYSVDRGIDSDIYTATLTCDGDTEEVLAFRNSLVNHIQTGEATIINSKVPLFGDHIDNSAPVAVVVTSLSAVKGTSIRSATTDVTVRSLNPSYIGASEVPPLVCLQAGQSHTLNFGGADANLWDGGSNYIDRDIDAPEFDGEYLLTPDSAQKLLRYWTVQRGNVFFALDNSWGVNYMFGQEHGNAGHNVVIDNIKWSYRSPSLRAVTVQLRRVAEAV